MFSTVLPDDVSKLQELMQKVGGPVSTMKPEQVILVAVAGSAMYNLNTPSSDIDYVVVYSTPVNVRQFLVFQNTIGLIFFDSLFFTMEDI